MSTLIERAMREWNQKNPPRDPDDTSPRQIVTKYPGNCANCGCVLPPGTIALFSPAQPARRKIACAACSEVFYKIKLHIPNEEQEMTHLESLLASLGYKQLVELYKGVAGKTFGFNYANHPATAKKSDLIKYLIKELENGALQKGAEQMLRGEFKGYNGPRDNREEMPELPKSEYDVDAPDPEGGDGDGEQKEGNGQQGKGGKGDGENKGQSKGKGTKGKGDGEGEGEDGGEGGGEGEGEDEEEALLKKIVKKGGGVTEKRVKEIVNEALEELPANGGGGPMQRIEVKSPNVPEGVKFDGAHPLFEKVLLLASAGINVMLKGPAGCGKTHLAGDVAKALGKRFAHISGSAGASESQLIGRLLPTGDGGKFEYHQSPFVDMYENGGVFLFDEMDAFDPNTLLVVNTATANNGFMVEARSAKPDVVRGEGTVLLAAVNTFGTGADAQYVGRFALDAATLDRWYIVEMGYHSEYEASLFGGDAPNVSKWKRAGKPSPDEIKALGLWVWGLRAKAEAAKLKRIVSTRMIQKLVAARVAGVPAAEAKQDLLAGWSRDEKQKVGVV